MKIYIVIFVVLSSISMSCNSTKSGRETNKSPEGTWQLNYISGPRITFDGLYPNKKPTITFDLKENRISGNNGCNTFTGVLIINGNKIDLTKPMATTKMMCLNGQQGEELFMNTLIKINSYSISNDGKTLTFISGDIAMMRFTFQK